MKYNRAPKAGVILLSGLAAVGSVIDPKHPHNHNEARATFVEPLTYDLGGTATFAMAVTAYISPEYVGWPPEDFDTSFNKILKQT